MYYKPHLIYPAPDPEAKRKITALLRSRNARSGPGIETKYNEHNYTKYFPDPHRVSDPVSAALFFTHMYRYKFTISAATKSGQFCPFLNRSVQ
jgi:hypothetical protein